MSLNKKNILVTVIGLVSAFVIQMLWLINSLSYSTDNIKLALNKKLENALFEEAEMRACHFGKSIPISPINSNKPDIAFFETELNKASNSNISFNQVEKILDNMIASDYSIILFKNNKQYYYKGKYKIQLSVKSDILYLKTNKSEAIQIVLANPYSLFFEELGLLMLASFLMLSITIYCIFQQVKIIYEQEEKARVKKEFTYAMIHDIKTPLSSIRLGLTALNNERIINEEKKRTKYLQVISTETQHAYSLINRILTISKSESRKLDLRKVQVELSNMLLNIEHNFKVNCHKVITFEHNIKYPFVYADKEYLKEIFYNLIDNSIKYSKKNVTICISSEKVNKGVVIHVKDNGIGISKSDQKIIFEKYERAAASNRTFKKGGAPGFGLGLTYVFQVVDTHNGMMGVESQPGKYTEFTIFLPDQSEK